jgi:hypothetical protein
MGYVNVVKPLRNRRKKENTNIVKGHKKIEVFVEMCFKDNGTRMEKLD